MYIIMHSACGRLRNDHVISTNIARVRDKIVLILKMESIPKLQTFSEEAVTRLAESVKPTRRVT